MPESKEVPNACSPCSARKRRCDRVMPICGWCARRNDPCYYVDHNNKQDLPGFPEKGFRLLFQQGRAAGPDSGCSKDLDSSLTAHLLDTLHQLTLDLGDMTECFLLFVQPWMPIIHPATLRQKVLTLRGAPSAELACFLLHILLVNPPSSLPSLRAFLPVLYEDCKSLFYLLQARRRDRLLTIQSGLLLAVYEQGHCSSSDAYISLASCASLAHVMRLGQPFDGTASANDESREDRRRVWWALYFLDRLNYYSDKKTARIPLLRNAQMGDCLPGNDELWGYSDGWTRSAPSTVPSIPGKGLMAIISAFGELIQAINTMECVLQLTRELSIRPETLVDQKSWKLDLLIQQKIHNSLTYSKPLHHQYMVVALDLMALIELHEKRLVCFSRQSDPSSIRESSAAALEMALNIFGELMKVDDNSKILEIDRMPVTAAVLFEKMASVVILLESQHSRNIEDAVQALTRAMERASKRWGVIGETASHIRAARVSL